MLRETSNNHIENIFSKNTTNAEEKTICKDGFCSLPNPEEMPKQDTKNMNLFDPIE